MTHNEQLDAIRAAAIKANPSIKLDPSDWNYQYYSGVRPIRLADVLLAIGKAENNALRSFPRDATVDARGILSSYFSLTDKRGESWKLHLDDLTQQSPECITFLADLLK